MASSQWGDIRGLVEQRAPNYAWPWERLLPSFRAPVAIGGVGGSGTRLVAGLVQGLGYHLGQDLNESRDNLWFTLLFKHPGARQLPLAEVRRRYRILLKAMLGGDPLAADERQLVEALALEDRPQHPADWLGERARSLIAAASGPRRPRGPWGWKEPNSHVFAEPLMVTVPRLRYVHVVRNGLDMAFSSNQNQLLLWGPELLGLPAPRSSPRLSLAFWCAAHRAVLTVARRYPGRVLILDYDGLCADPAAGVEALCRFLGARPSTDQRRALAALPVAPQSLGRYREHPDADLDPADVAFVARLGFPAEPFVGAGPVTAPASTAATGWGRAAGVRPVAG